MILFENSPTIAADATMANNKKQFENLWGKN